METNGSALTIGQHVKIRDYNATHNHIIGEAQILDIDNYDILVKFSHNSTSPYKNIKAYLPWHTPIIYKIL